MTGTLLQAEPPQLIEPRRPVFPWSTKLKQLIRPAGPVVPLSPATIASIWTMAALSALAAWFVLYTVLFSGLQESRNNSVLYSQLRESLSGATTPIGGVIKPGTPIALIDAPGTSLGRLVVVEGTAPTDLRNGPGHRRDTPLPGQPGVSVLYGRSVSYGGPFGGIAKLRAGQRFTITTGQGQFSYTVDRVRHAGDPLPLPMAAGSSRLMLETSTGIGLNPTSTVFLDASLDGKPVGAPDGRLTAVPQVEQAMATDSSGLIKLVLWIQLLLVVAVIVVWSRARWGAAQSWLIGLPMVFAVLWGATGNVLMLLPNLL